MNNKYFKWVLIFSQAVSLSILGIFTYMWYYSIMVNKYVAFTLLEPVTIVWFAEGFIFIFGIISTIIVIFEVKSRNYFEHRSNGSETNE